MNRFPFASRYRARVVTAVLLVAVLVLLLSACASAPQQVPEEPEQEYVWGPPTDPVIRWERAFRTAKEFEQEERKSSWKDALLGEEQEDERFVYLKTPYGLSADSSGRVYLADPGLVGIPVFDFRMNRFLNPGEEGPVRFAGALGVTSDREGNIYATEGNGAKVHVFDRDGQHLRTIGGGDEFGRPVGIAVDDERGRLYVSDTLKHHIAVFDLEGNALETIGERGADPGRFNFPLAITVGEDGRLYVVDSMNFRVQVLNPDGDPVRTISKQGDRPGELARPRGVAVDSDGHIYVSDVAFNNVQIFDQEGRHLLTIGGAGAGPGGFQFPSGLAFDADDRLYVADQLNKRVQVFRYLGVPTPEAIDAMSAED